MLLTRPCPVRGSSRALGSSGSWDTRVMRSPIRFQGRSTAYAVDSPAGGTLRSRGQRPCPSRSSRPSARSQLLNPMPAIVHDAGIASNAHPVDETFHPSKRPPTRRGARAHRRPELPPLPGVCLPCSSLGFLARNAASIDCRLRTHPKAHFPLNGRR